MNENLVLERSYSGKSHQGNIIREYQIGEFLGQGGFAECYKVKNLQTQQVFAMKRIEKQSLKRIEAKKCLIEEIKIHKKLKHKYIVEFYHFFQDENYAYILLEYCNNKTLKDLKNQRQRITEIELKYYIQQIVKALKYLRREKVLHRDLKLENILIDNKMRIRIADFGLSTIVEDNTKETKICGSHYYLAPEIFKLSYSYEIDIWALGIMSYFLIVGQYPFFSRQKQDLYQKIQNGKYYFPSGLNISDNCKDFINQLLIMNPSKRIQLQQIMHHPFMNQGIGVPFLLPQKTLKQELNQKQLENYITKQNVIINGLQVQQKINDVFICNQVDYTKKYGYGYTLSNNCYGVFFNDLTKINIDRDFSYIQYVSKIQTHEYSKTYFMLSDYPQKLEKKVQILLKFIQFFTCQKLIQSSFSNDAKKQFNLDELIYIKKVKKLQYGYLFFLSNNIVQMIFNDQTLLIISPNSQLVVYQNKNKHQYYCEIQTALKDTNFQLVKRLQYVKRQVQKLISNQIKFDNKYLQISYLIYQQAFQNSVQFDQLIKTTLTSPLFNPCENFQQLFEQ